MENEDNQEDCPDDHAALEEIRRELRETISFYSNEGKSAREKWVVSEFLTIARIPFTESEIVGITTSAPDVEFRDARFEVKEILDENRSRHHEYRQKLAKAEAARCLRDLSEIYIPSPITIDEVVALIKKDLRERASQYSLEFQKSCDILYYVNLQFRFLSRGKNWPSPFDFAEFGWRSISFLKGRGCSVFFAATNSPEFLRGLESRLIITQEY